MINVAEVLRGWKTILAGRTPFLSIEITKECPLSCPGCYAYGSDHLGGETVLRQVSDFQGQTLVDRVIALIDAYRPLHVSFVGGEPLVRFRELQQIFPVVEARGIHIQLVTSAVRPIPAEWSNIKRMTIVVSIDGLAPEHDVRRKPATYERILKNIEGTRITVHCTITRQMTDRPGYLSEFIKFWSALPNVEKIWMSMFTPQIGENSYEILPKDRRMQVIRELLELGETFPKLAMPPDVLDGFANPPANPESCIFARTTTTVTADLTSKITPCQFGGTPDCTQCGCMASAGLKAVGDYRLPFIGIKAGTIYNASLGVGTLVARMRKLPNAPSSANGRALSKAG
jgi:MoaA/NifB/PqqE/SkfB family radical SAM enzyme